MLRSIALAATALAAFSLPAVPAEAGKARFVFAALVPPGNSGQVYLTGVYQNQAVGGYTMANGTPAGFVWSGGNYTTVSAVYGFDALSDSGVAVGSTPGSSTSYTSYDVTSGATRVVDYGPPGNPSFSIGGINASGAVVATQYTPDNRKTACRPFEQASNGTYSWLAQSEVRGLVPFGVTDDNLVVMSRWCDYHYSGNYYLFRNGKQRRLTIRGGTEISVGFVNGAGFGGSFLDSNAEFVGYTLTGENLKLTTYVMPPGVRGLDVLAIGPHHEVAGYFVDKANYYHGFIYAGRRFYTIDFPEQKSAMITGFSSTGAIVGYFGNLDFNHGFPSNPFVATCASVKGCTK